MDHNPTFKFPPPASHLHHFRVSSMQRSAKLVPCAITLLCGWVSENANAQVRNADMPKQAAVVQTNLADATLGLFESKSTGHSHGDRKGGTILICGGGALPIRIRQEFYSLGKGNEGTLVLIPTASPRSDAQDFAVWIDYWGSFAWKSVKVVHAMARDDAFQPQAIDTLRSATAIWVSGGDQRRLSDRYLDTPIQDELRACFDRGGIIGGTSAGAAIASTNMISGGMIDPQFCDGLGLVPGAIIDQHFSTRHRYQRLTHAIQTYPDRIGMGIDESTGVFITKDHSRVVGDGSVVILQSDRDHQLLDKEIDDRRYTEGDRLSTRELRLLAP